jgi:hypothetical protein
MQEAAVGLLDAAIVSNSPYCRRRTQPAQCQQWPMSTTSPVQIEWPISERSQRLIV